MGDRRGWLVVLGLGLLVVASVLVWSSVEVAPADSSTPSVDCASESATHLTAEGGEDASHRGRPSGEAGSVATESRANREAGGELAGRPTVSGRFVDRVTRRGLPGVALGVRPANQRKKFAQSVPVGADGAFAVELEPSTAHAYSFDARVRGCELIGDLLRMPPAGVDLGEIPIGPFVIPRLRTVDLGGRPVAGVVLELYQQVVPDWSDPASVRFVGARVHAESGADGSVGFGEFPAGGWYVACREPYEVVHPLRIRIGRDGERRDITVRKVELVEFSGTVIDARGGGLAGVQLTSLDGDGRFIHTTDANGRFNAEVASGATIQGIRGGHAERGRFVWKSTWSVPSTGVRLVWPDQATAQLRVVDAVTNEPVLLRSVKAFDLGQWRPVGGEILGPGQVRVAAVPLVGCSVWLEPGPGHQAVADVRVPAEPVGPITVRIAPSVRCVVRVQDGRGEPIGGAVVTVLGSRGDGAHFARASDVAPVIAQFTSLWHGFAKTGADGVARVSGTLTQKQQLLVQAEGRASRMVPLSQQSMVVTLRAGTRIHGVVDLRNWNARVAVPGRDEGATMRTQSRLTPTGLVPMPWRVEVKLVEGEPTHHWPTRIEPLSAMVDERGAYRLATALPSGRWRVRLISPYSPVPVAEHGITLAGQPEQRVDFRLGESGFGRVDLTVTINGEPSSQALFLGNAALRLDADGRANAEWLAGSYVAEAYLPVQPLLPLIDGSWPRLKLGQPLEVKPGETTAARLDFVYREAIVRVTRESEVAVRQPAAGILVIAEGADGELTRGETNAHGAIRVDRPPAEFWVRCPDGARRGPFEFPKGVESRVFDVVLR